MAMSGSGLSSEIRSAIAALADPKDHNAIWDAIGAAIINHIKNNASVAVTVTSVTGVTTGTGVSGAGSGTGTIS